MVTGTIRFTIIDAFTVILDHINLRADAALYYQAMNEAGLDITQTTVEANKNLGNIVEMNSGGEWDRALIICVERGKDMVSHAIAKMLLYNAIILFV